jgi:potassium channel subfamily K, other eukaryote
LYFTYTTLLTIGYGDFLPQSNAGKPFFVLWSLVAVPTVTIFISNMGSTVVRWVEQGTLWLARWTVLPEKRPKTSTRKLTGDVGETDEEKDTEYHHGSRGIAEQELRGEVEKIGERVERAEVEHGEGTSLPARLAREIRGLAKDVGKKPPRKYSWDEWRRWVKLLEEEDNNKKRPRNALGTTESRDKFGEEDEEDWIWLSEDGPLFSRMGETEWVLGRLCERLEEVLEERVNRQK